MVLPLDPVGMDLNHGEWPWGGAYYGQPLSPSDIEQNEQWDRVLFDYIDIPIGDHGATTGAETPGITETAAGAIEPTDAGSASGAETPTLTQVHSLGSADHGATTGAETTALSQVHALGSADHGAASGAELPTLTQNHILSSADHGAASGAELPSVTLNIELGSADHGAASGAETPAISTTVLEAPSYEVDVDFTTLVRAKAEVSTSYNAIAAIDVELGVLAEIIIINEDVEEIAIIKKSYGIVSEIEEKIDVDFAEDY